MKTMLDSTVSLNVRGQFHFNFYNVYQEIKKRGADTVYELYEIFECLTMFFKDLDWQLKILVNEFLTMKTDVSDLKKGPRIKWMNDENQKKADIRDLLLSDGGAPFVDLSKERTQAPVFDL